jgi:hypothetical protein
MPEPDEQPAKPGKTPGAKPCEPPKPRRLRRTLLIVAVVCVSAVLMAATVHGILRARWEKRTIGNGRAFVRAQAAHYNDKHLGQDSNGVRRYAPWIWDKGRLVTSDEGGDPAFVFSCLPPGAYDPVPRVAPPGFFGDGYSFREMTSIAGQSIDWTKDFAFCAKPARYWWTGRRVFIIKTDGVIWAKDLGRSEFVADFPADPAREGWLVVE